MQENIVAAEEKEIQAPAVNGDGHCQLLTEQTDSATEIHKRNKRFLVVGITKKQASLRSLGS